MEKRNKIIYWIATGLFSLLMLFSTSMYLFQHEMVVQMFTSFGFPTYIIYPLAAAKILGLIAIWSRKSKTLIEWAYAGFFFDTLLAAGAHLGIGEGAQLAVTMTALVLISYIFQRKVFATN